MKHSMEYLKEKLLTALWVALFSGCAALAVIGQKTISYLSAGLMLAAWGRALGGLPLDRALPAVFVGSAVGATACFAMATVPVEGATGWADSTMLHAEAAHPTCAYLWMEHSLKQKVQGDLSAWFGSVPAVPAACKGNALLGDEGCARQGFNAFDRIAFWRTPTTQCPTQNNQCVPYHRWVSDYIAVLGGR